MNPQQESAWLAGILEGEGCFTLKKTAHKNGRPTFRVCVKMTDKDVIEGLFSLHPSKCKIYSRKESEGKKIAYELIWYGQIAETLARRTYPYLYSRRKARIDEILAMDLSHHTKRKRINA